jgi:hypothetical protein
MGIVKLGRTVVVVIGGFAMRKEPPPIEVQFGWAMADGWNE